tara:strand:- start:233 stop:400 length:168 start_codon:yes stop_codon:yes gene_type:complete
MKAFGRRCVGKVGGLLRHPTMIRITVLVTAKVVFWLLKVLIVALLTTAGMALPVG